MVLVIIAIIIVMDEVDKDHSTAIIEHDFKNWAIAKASFNLMNSRCYFYLEFIQKFLQISKDFMDESIQNSFFLAILIPHYKPINFADPYLMVTVTIKGLEDVIEDLKFEELEDVMNDLEFVVQDLEFKEQKNQN